MLNQIRLFISAHSPDWLNVEVNKDFFTNFSAALTPDHESEELETNSVGSTYSYGVLPLPTSSAPEASSASSASSACTGFPFQGRPHWRRIKQVFEVLEQAGTGTYTELVNYVREVTGIGCSRKLISKWKRERHLCFASSQNDQQFEVPAFSFVGESNVREEREPRQLSVLEASSIISSDCQSQEHLADYSPSPPVSQSPSLRVSPSPRQAWSYLAATAIVVGVVGFDWPHPQSQNGDNTIQVAVAQEIESPIQNPAAPRFRGGVATALTQSKSFIQNRLPRNIKISLTLSSRQDLKVKQGDKVVEGQVLSDRTSSRSRLLGGNRRFVQPGAA